MPPAEEGGGISPFLSCLRHGSGGFLQFGQEGPELFSPVLLGLHHVGGGLVDKAGVAQLGLQLVQLGPVLLELLLNAGLLLLQIHQLGQGHEQPGGVGGDGDHALGGHGVVAARVGHALHGHIAQRRPAPGWRR